MSSVPLAWPIVEALIQVRAARDRLDHVLVRHGVQAGLRDRCIIESLMMIHASLGIAKEALDAGMDIVDGLEKEGSVVSESGTLENESL